MAYTKPQYQGIDRFLNNIQNSPTEQNEGYLVHGGYTVGGGGRSLPQGIAKLLMSKKNAENEANYGNEQQAALESGNLDVASGNAAASGDMDTAVNLAAAAENAKQRNAMLGIERAKLNKEQVTDLNKKNMMLNNYQNNLDRINNITNRVKSNKTAFNPAIAEAIKSPWLSWAVNSSSKGDRGYVAQEGAALMKNIVSDIKASGATGQMMNTEKEAERLTGVLSNSAATAEEILAGMESLKNTYEQELKQSGSEPRIQTLPIPTNTIQPKQQSKSTFKVTKAE